MSAPINLHSQHEPAIIHLHSVRQSVSTSSKIRSVFPNNDGEWDYVLDVVKEHEVNFRVTTNDASMALRCARRDDGGEPYAPPFIEAMLKEKTARGF